MKTKSILQNAIFASITVALIFSFTVSKINNVNVLDFFDGVLKTEASTGNISPSFLCSTGTYRQTPSVYTAADLTFTTPLDTPVIFTGSTFANALSPSLTADESPTSLCIQSLPNFGQLYQDNLLINPNPVISPYGFNMSYDIYPNFTKYVPPEGFKGLACFSYYTRYASPQILLVNGNNPLDTNVSQIRISVGGSTRTTCGADGPASTSGTINGKVYNDINQNGFQDINEQDYNITNNLLPAGTNIKITKVDNPAISYTVSPNADGTYSKYLPASQYTILVNIASGYTVTQSTELGDTGNSGANPTTVTVPASDGAISAGKDGIYKLNLPGTITGKIYPEIRIDGIQDAFESDYNSTFNSVPNNTTVTITDITNPSNTFTITPNPNGTYSQPVTPGQYTVTVNPNPNYRVSNSTDIGDPTNSGSNPTTVTITSGQTKSVGNDGIYKKHEITGSLYPDLNNSGVQDNGETYSLSNPLPTGTQVKIECLYPALTTFTYFPVPDNNGNYIQQVEDFNISGTTCKTTITPPTSYLISNSTELGNNGAGSNPTVVAMPAGAIAVSQGKDGLYQVPLPSTITGKIYPDLNGNGIQDTNEPDYSASNPYPTGTRVSFVADLNLIDACAVYPNVDGSYTSCNLSEYLANYWKVIIRPVENYAITNSNDNGTGTGSNPTVINLPRGASVSAGKDGIFKIPKNSGIIFWDKNNNGFQDIDENGIPGVTVTSTNTLFPNNQTFNVTGDSGYYHFDYPENNTTITVTMPTGFTSNTYDLDGNRDGAVQLNNTLNESLNFGYIGNGSISGNVWTDSNKNGTRETGEPNVYNTYVVAIFLINGYSFDSFTYTDVNGNYYFTNLPTSNYQVIVDSNYKDYLASNNNPFTLAIGEQKTNVDFHYTPNIITGKVYNDTNQNGIQDANEPDYSTSNPVPAETTITIINDNDQTDTSTFFPNVDGTYSYQTNSEYNRSWSHSVTVATNSDYIITQSQETGDGTGSNPTTIAHYSKGETKAAGKDGLFKIPVTTITGKIYPDLNNNGFQDSSEPNFSSLSPIIPGTTVNIASQTNTNLSFVTVINPDGSYSQQVPPGQYSITINTPSSYLISMPNQVLGINTKITAIQIVAGETKSAGNEGLFNGILPPIIPTNPISTGGVITIQPSQTVDKKQLTNAERALQSVILSQNQSNPTLAIDRKFDLNDPYVCGEYVYGNVISNPNIIANLNIEFTQDGKIVKTYNFKTNPDGTWKQMLDDMPYGKYSYKVIASYQELTDTESFEIQHKSKEDCENKDGVKDIALNSSTIRTGSQYNYSMFAIMIVLFLGLISIPVGRKE